MWGLILHFRQQMCYQRQHMKYQEADQNLQPYILPMVAAAVLLVVTAIWILVLAFTFLMEYGTGDSESCGYQ